MLARGLLVAVALWAAPSSTPGAGEAAAAIAAPVRLRLERGEGAASCPDEEHLRAAIVERLDYDPFDPSAERSEPLEIRCTLSRDGRGFHARLRLWSGASAPVAERQIASHGANCSELQQAIEIAISVAIGPRMPPPQPMPPPFIAPAPVALATPPASTAPRPLTAPAAPTPAAGRLSAAPTTRPVALADAPGTTVIAAGHPSAPTGRTGFFELGAAAGITAGLTPGIAPSLDLFGAWNRRAFSLGIEARLVAPSSADLGGGTVKAALWTAALVPCLRTRALALCGVVTGGVLRAHAEGIVLANSTQTPVADVGLRAGVRYPLGEHLALSASAEVAAALVTSHLTIDGSDAWVSPRLSTAGALGLVGIFR